MGDPSKAEYQTLRALMHYSHSNIQNKSYNDHFSKRVIGPLNKSPRLPRTLIYSLHHWLFGKTGFPISEEVKST